MEACSFWPAFQEAIASQVNVIHLVHPQRAKAIASAKLKNDRVDSATLAHLLRCQLLPEAWMADRAARERPQQVRLRISFGQHRAALKNQVHEILHQHGKRSPVTDTFGRHAHVARVALARKLLAAVFALLRDGECFDETNFATM
jgi:hypothetical protein